MSLSYYVAIQGETYGPADLSTLASWAQAGSFTAQDFVWDEASAQWVVAGWMTDTAPLFGTLPPLAPPTPIDAPSAAPKKRAAETATGTLQKIEEIAAMAGIQCVNEGKYLVVPFRIGENRRQAVFVNEYATLPDGMHVISFFSPCGKNKPGFLAGMSKAQAIDLLRRNGHSLFGGFVLARVRDEEYIAFQTTQIIETMEVEEFRDHANAVASLADGYEAQMGQDSF